MRHGRALVAVALAAAALAGCGEDDDGGGSGAGGDGDTDAPQAADLGRGGRLFVAKCGSCHTLAAAGAKGDVGPRLDVLRPAAATVEQAIASGPGVMPEKLVTGADAKAVARFVEQNAGR